MPNQRAYFIIPSVDYAPGPNSLIRLGQIISNIGEPHSPLSEPLLPRPKTRTAWVSDFSFDNSAELVSSLGLKAAFLAQLGNPLSGSLSGTVFRNDGLRMQAKRLKTEFIEPDASYVEASVLEVPAVREHVERNRRLGITKSVYMITGIKIAKGASIERFKSRGMSGNVEVKIDATVAS